MLVPWSVLRPSSQARRVRRSGYAIAGVSSVALFSAAFISDPFDARRWILAFCVATLCLLAARYAPRRKALEVGVAQNGEIRLRACRSSDGSVPDEIDPEEPIPFRVSFAAPWLISLRSGTMFVPIWPDCLPPTVYRQLWVHLHWGRAAPADDDRKTRMPPDRSNAR